LRETVSGRIGQFGSEPAGQFHQKFGGKFLANQEALADWRAAATCE